ncbi:MAG: 2-phospho-L-lactate guanylyltransferase [Microthrixaceae bacterium]
MPTPRTSDAAPAATTGDVLVLVPVKAFAVAKVRLADVLDPDERARLARELAAGVLRAAAPHAVAVVCDDEDVAAWARSLGASVSWQPGAGLNRAIGAAYRDAGAAGRRRVVVVHGDLAFPAPLSEFVTRSAGGPDDVVLVADRRRDGTNVLSVPTGHELRFRYGAGSFDAHRAEADGLGLSVRVHDDDHLAWDVDVPGDLTPPPELGLWPSSLPPRSAGA